MRVCFLHVEVIMLSPITHLHPALVIIIVSMSVLLPTGLERRALSVVANYGKAIRYTWQVHVVVLAMPAAMSTPA